MTGPHEYTTKECRDMFLAYVWDMIEYWGSHDPCVIAQEGKTERSRLEGLAFSILVALKEPGFSGSPIMVR